MRCRQTEPMLGLATEIAVGLDDDGTLPRIAATHEIRTHRRLGDIRKPAIHNVRVVGQRCTNGLRRDCQIQMREHEVGVERGLHTARHHNLMTLGRPTRHQGSHQVTGVLETAIGLVQQDRDAHGRQGNANGIAAGLRRCEPFAWVAIGLLSEKRHSRRIEPIIESICKIIRRYYRLRVACEAPRRYTKECGP